MSSPRKLLVLCVYQQGVGAVFVDAGKVISLQLHDLLIGLEFRVRE